MIATPPPGPLAMSEADWQGRVVDTAKALGWRVCHIRNVRVGTGTRTRWLVPYAGDGGLPDLILAKDGRLLLVELKAEKGGFKPGQLDWLRAAGDNGYCWRPSDWPTVQAVLRGQPDPVPLPLEAR